jgi:hypothetical protein
MNSFLIYWLIDDIDVHCLSGADYVKGKTSKDAKQALRSHLQERYPHVTRIEIGRASHKLAPSEDRYIN